MGDGTSISSEDVREALLPGTGSPTHEIPYMKSQNFEFLRPKRGVLADLAGFAERYAHDDPASSLLKQRSFIEVVVAAIYERYRLMPPYSDALNDLMNGDAFPRRPISSQLSLDSLSQRNRQQAVDDLVEREAML
jgi:hypothetical protein